jgi:hypothetical protein
MYTNAICMINFATISADPVESQVGLTAPTPTKPCIRAPPPRPPRSKDACYLDTAKKLRARCFADQTAWTKGAAGMKKTTKKHQAEIQRDEKQAKETRVNAKSLRASCTFVGKADQTVTYSCRVVKPVVRRCHSLNNRKPAPRGQGAPKAGEGGLERKDQAQENQFSSC